MELFSKAKNEKNRETISDARNKTAPPCVNEMMGGDCALPEAYAAQQNSAAQNSGLERLIARMAKGDSSALAELYNDLASPVYGFALSILRNTHDAEDVLQDTFVKIWSAAGSYTPRGKPMAWILTVTKNLSLSRFREQRHTADIGDEEWQMLYVVNPAVTGEDRLVLEAAMNGLSPDDRQIVMLHAVAGLKHAEISEMMNIPLSTVLSKYNRAKKKLQTLIEGGE